MANPMYAQSAYSTPHIQTTYGYGTGSVKICAYGPSGVGKTSLCGTAPNPIIASAESGLLTLRRLNLPFVAITTFAELLNFYRWCEGSMEARQFTTICLDSASEIAEVVLRHEKQQTKDPRKAYGELLDQVVGLIKGFRDLPQFHFLCLAKEEMQKDEQAGMLLYQPSFPGQKLAPAVPYLFDEVFHAEKGVDPTTGQEWRALRTAMSSRATAKDRSGSLAEYEPMNIAAIIEKIARG